MGFNSRFRAKGLGGYMKKGREEQWTFKGLISCNWSGWGSTGRPWKREHENSGGRIGEIIKVGIRTGYPV